MSKVLVIIDEHGLTTVVATEGVDVVVLDVGQAKHDAGAGDEITPLNAKFKEMLEKTGHDWPGGITEEGGLQNETDYMFEIEDGEEDFADIPAGTLRRLLVIADTADKVCYSQDPFATQKDGELDDRIDDLKEALVATEEYVRKVIRVDNPDCEPPYISCRRESCGAEVVIPLAFGGPGNYLLRDPQNVTLAVQATLDKVNSGYQFGSVVGSDGAAYFFSLETA